MEQSSIERIMNERRQKALKLKELGFNPYVNGYSPSIDNKSFIEKYDKFSKEELLEVQDSFSIAGRVMSVRSMGKAAFIVVKDASASLQVFLQKEHLSENDFAAFKLLDMGDFVFAHGKPMKTKTGELSLNIDNFKILTKTLRPLPEKWHGLTNVEERYRHREVDLIVNDKAAWIFRTRSKKLLDICRIFLDQRGFIEVETPVLTDIAGGAEAKPFLTHHNALSEDLCMRIATEIPLKRLIVGGMEKVYEIGRMFRNEGVSTKHNPEFTSIEFYQAYATYENFIELTQEFFKGLVRHIHGTDKIEYQGHILDFSKPFRRVPIAQLVAEHLGFDEQKTKELIAITSVKEALNITHKKLVSEEEAIVLCLKDLNVEEMNSILPEFLEEPAHSHMDLLSAAKIVKTKDFSDVLVMGEKIDKALSLERRRSLALNLLYGVFDHQVEQNIIQPTFITDFCVSNSPLARKRDGDEAVVDRFELIIAKMEVANAFSELNDADDQRERFVRQAQMKFMGEEEACEVDEAFLHSLEVGMPPAAGQGIGIDRLVMLLTNSASIREVILFPKMKRK